MYQAGIKENVALVKPETISILISITHYIIVEVNSRQKGGADGLVYKIGFLIELLQIFLQE